jgi:hypothetical protein
LKNIRDGVTVTSPATGLTSVSIVHSGAPIFASADYPSAIADLFARITSQFVLMSLVIINDIDATITGPGNISILRIKC